MPPEQVATAPGLDLPAALDRRGPVYLAELCAELAWYLRHRPAQSRELWQQSQGAALALDRCELEIRKVAT